jgi:hypothetical protein
MAHQCHDGAMVPRNRKPEPVMKVSFNQPTRYKIAASVVSIAIGIALLASGACSSDAAGPAPVANVITIHGADFSYTAPPTIPAGMTTVNFVNDGPALHQAQIVRLDSGKTVADLKTALALPGALPGWVVQLGGPNAVDPGLTGNATLNLAAGNYALLCVVNVPGGVPHFMKGMVQPLTVTAAGSKSQTAAAPIADETVTMDDYAFKLSASLTAGTHTFKVINPDEQPHELELIRLAPGKTAADMLAWLQTQNGPPPRQALGGVAIISPSSGPAYFTADFTSGTYMLLCFVFDSGDGKPHFAHGMVLPITIP